MGALPSRHVAIRDIRQGDRNLSSRVGSLEPRWPSGFSRSKSGRASRSRFVGDEGWSALPAPSERRLRISHKFWRLSALPGAHARRNKSSGKWKRERSLSLTSTARRSSTPVDRAGVSTKKAQVLYLFIPHISFGSRYGRLLAWLGLWFPCCYCLDYERRLCVGSSMLVDVIAREGKRK